MTNGAYLEQERARGRKANRPIYRFSLDRYECPFCRFTDYDETLVWEHMPGCAARKQ